MSQKGADMAKREFLKELTKDKARKAMLPLLVGELLGAENLGKGKSVYGIVVEWKMIETYLKSKDKTVDPRWRDWIWAIWKPKRQEAIEAYETATENELVPMSAGGLLTTCDPSEFQFELIDQG